MISYLLPVCLFAYAAALIVAAVSRTFDRHTLASALVFWFQLIISTLVLAPIFYSSAVGYSLPDFIAVTRLSAAFVLLTQFVVACAATQAHFFFSVEHKQGKLNLLRLKAFSLCSWLFSIAMSLVFLSDNLGATWIAMEATTLCSAPLVGFYQTRHSLEAAWKYLIICSVGIAFALFGTILLCGAGQSVGGFTATLSQRSLVEQAHLLDFTWLKFGFLFSLLGYGTKAGLFPLNSWLPDAHSEAPAPASAMLSGGLLNCALYAIWKQSQIVLASEHGDLCQVWLVRAGVLTALVASIMLIRQHAIKRMFAYSSIENVGLMLVAIGLRLPWLFFLLALNHSLAKVSLFLTAGNVIQTTGTKKLRHIHGLLGSHPVLGLTLLLGAIAVTGAPPFGAFAAECCLLSELCNSELWWIFGGVSAALTISFLAVVMHVGRTMGGSLKDVPGSNRLAFCSGLIPGFLLLLTVVTGIIGLPAFPTERW